MDGGTAMMTASTNDPHSLRGVRAVIVEDNFAVASSLEYLLSGYDCDVLGMAAGVEAGLRLVDRSDYDIAFLDIRLGNELVTDVARRVHQRGKRIIYLTGYADSELLPEDLRSHPCLPKPVEAETLIATILAGG
jgi:two-component SAPR family response regulator